MTDVLVVEELAVVCGEQTLLGGLSFELAQGQVLSVIGQSGAGKSLAMLSLLGMQTTLKVSGRAVFCGERLPIDKPQAKRWQDIRGRKIGYIFQDPRRTLNPLHSIKTAFDKIFAQLGIAKKQRHAKMLELLCQVQLPKPQDFFNRYPHQLSGGEAQRIAIALVLALEPTLIIADEPTSGLDAPLKVQILSLFRSLANQRRAVIIISHDTEQVAAVSDKCVRLHQGRQLGKKAPALMECHISAMLGVPSTFDVCKHKLLLQIRALTLAYKQGWFARLPVIDGLDINIYQGQIVGLVGRSGIGKSSVAKAIVRLDDDLLIGGQITFFDDEQGAQAVLELDRRQRQHYRPKVVWVMQNVAESLNPDIKILDSLTEGSPQTSLDEVYQWLAMVGLGDDVLGRYPRQLSGGECARVCLLRALLVRPKLLILDEPTAMLDVQTTQQILQLLRQINQTTGVAMLLISHDKSVVQALCHQVVAL